MKALKDRDALPMTLSEEDKDDLLEHIYNVIQLSLTDEVLREVADEETAAGHRKKLECLYMKKSLTNHLH